MPNLIRSLGLGFIFIPVSVAALSDLPIHQRGNATGLFNLTRELGGSLGTAWMGKVVADGIATHSAQLGEHLTLYDAAAQMRWTAVAKSGLEPALVLGTQLRQQSMVLSFEDGFRLTTMAILCGLFMVAMLKKPKAGPAPAGAH